MTPGLVRPVPTSMEAAAHLTPESGRQSRRRASAGGSHDDSHSDERARVHRHCAGAQLHRRRTRALLRPHRRGAVPQGGRRFVHQARSDLPQPGDVRPLRRARVRAVQGRRPVRRLGLHPRVRGGEARWKRDTRAVRGATRRPRLPPARATRSTGPRRSSPTRPATRCPA